MASGILRSITRRVLPTRGKALQRIVGSLDFKGQGTEHTLAEVDPVILCDVGEFNGKGLPPFGLHPHYGLIAVTTMVEGCFMDVDNINGASDHLHKASGIYAVSSGRGVCHDEHSATDGKHLAIQTIFRIPADKLHFPPEVARVHKEDIPVMEMEGGKLKIDVGKLGETESPVKLKAFPRAVVLRAFVEQGQLMQVPLDADLEHGFLVVIDGKCKLGAEKEELSKDGGCLIFGEGGPLVIDNSDGEGICDALIVAAKPFNEPWVKLLGKNGFIIARDEDEANKVMEVIEKEGMDFTYEKLAW